MTTGPVFALCGAVSAILVAPVVLAVATVALVSPRPSCAPDVDGTVQASGTITVAHANIKTTLSQDAFRGDLGVALGSQPDLVSLNEVAHRSDTQLAAPGYALWREPAPSVRGDDGTAVLWRTDRWLAIDRGRVMLVDHGPQRWDHDRAATWVSLQSTASSGLTVSMISAHQIINPARYGPQPEVRQQLYAAGMARLVALVVQLSTRGPVFVAGDFNSQWAANDPWGPRRTLAAAGMTSTMDALGERPTHDGGGTIDYEFYERAVATPTRQQTSDLASDHRLLVTDFAVHPSASATDRRESNPDALDATQSDRARAVIETGQQLGIPQEGIVIALAVVSQESGFRVYANDGRGRDLAPDQAGVGRSVDLPHDAVGSDHGSLGLFQQQWPWWGSLNELMDPATSARLFYEALAGVPAWEAMDPGAVAQAVQRSAYPGAYDDDIELARTIFAELTSGSDDCAAGPGQAVSDGSVVTPLAPSAGAVDLRNWGGHSGHWESWHTGTDLSVACGTPVRAVHVGTIEVDTAQPWAGPWLVKISRGPGDLTTWYAHMQRIVVTDGQQVSPGEVIGEVGAEGNATGCHLHFEVHLTGGSIYGPDNVDPSAWLATHVTSPENQI